MKKMTCLEFNDQLWNEGAYSEIHAELYWSDGYSSEKILKFFKEEAIRKNIELTDLEDFDYDKCFYDNYKSDDDKGLS